MKPFYQQSVSEVTEFFAVDTERGLTSQEVHLRHSKVGYNVLPEKKPTPLILIFLRQFTSPLVYLLSIAAVVSAFLGESIDAAVIVVALFLNASVGFYQEAKAQRILTSIKNLATPQAKVCRDGSIQVVNAADLVPGDLVFLETGSRVPADGRLITAYSLECDESQFTGESLPVTKHTETIKYPANINERTNSVFMGTTVVRGRGQMIVTNIGSDCETGKLTLELENIQKPQTPLFQQIAHFSRIIVWVVLITCLSIIFLGLWQKQLLNSFYTAVTLAVAAIPEGLPAMITITLALGIHQMAREKALVQNMSAVDTLGQVNSLVLDKTGTLTYNRFRVNTLILPENRFFKPHEVNSLSPYEAGLKDLLETMIQANNASSSSIDPKSVHDDPLEVALLEFGEKFHEKRQIFLAKYPKVFELPFESESRYMASFHRLSHNKIRVFIKGAPEQVLELCFRVKKAEKTFQLNKQWQDSFIDQAEKFQNQGDKVIALATGIIDIPLFEKIQLSSAKNRQQMNKNFDLLGAVIMSDPVRVEAAKSVKTLAEAGINIIIATGDHPAVARVVTEKVGLKPVIGTEKDLQPKLIYQSVKEKNVFAKIVPALKLQIIKTLQKQNKIVAMTGDGVNDAPALRQSDVGIAMGQTGTDLAKDSAEIILLDDDISTIVQAVKSGRVIIANIQRVVSQLISTNLAELLVISGGILIWSLAARPLLPTQVLWVNLATDSLIILPLALEPAHQNIMTNPPREKNDKLLSNDHWWLIGVSSFLIAATSLCIFAWNYQSTESLARAQTMTFTYLVFAQLFNLINFRSCNFSVFSKNLPKNFLILWIFLSSVILQLTILFLPTTQQFLHLAPLSLLDIFVLFTISSSVLWVVELTKMINRHDLTKRFSPSLHS